MRSAYRVLAYIIAVEVVIQAAAISYALAGLGKWVSDGGTLDKAAMESEDTTFTGVVGFIVHGINGQMLIPLLAVILLIISFFAKIPGGAKWAGLTLLLVVIQVLLGLFSSGIPQLAILHGANALALFAAAVYAGRRVAAHSQVPAEPQNA